jgi:hypothetical protein
MSQVHDVFHVSILELYLFNGRSESNPPPDVQVEGEEKYPVEEILDSKCIGW